MLVKVQQASPKFRAKFRGHKLKLKPENAVCPEAPGYLGTSANTRPYTHRSQWLQEPMTSFWLIQWEEVWVDTYVIQTLKKSLLLERKLPVEHTKVWGKSFP